MPPPGWVKRGASWLDGRMSSGNPGLAGLFYFLGRASPLTGVLHMAARLITYDDLASKGIRYSKVTLWRWEKQSKFPKRVPIGAGRYAYVESEIDEFVDRMITARDAKLAVAAA
jgi:prophage regulatory protein